jgi:hypothetical protein
MQAVNRGMLARSRLLSSLRTILLASATETSIWGLRANIRSNHEPAGAPWRHALRTIEVPPMMSSRLMVRSPCALSTARKTMF